MSEDRDDDELAELRRHAAIGRVVTGVVHESRNILAGVLSFAQIGKRKATTDPERAAQLFADIENEAKRCLEIFSHVLDLARGEAQNEKIGVEPIPVDVRSPLRSVSALVREQARLSEVTVEVVIPDHLPRVMATDRYLVQIFLNLCINALHASPPGGSVRIVGSTAGDWVTIRVTDSGAGVPRAKRETVFEPFFTTKGSEGTGLGLSESRKMAAELGGDLKLVTSVGDGATFSLRLEKAPKPDA